jgi:hypothetical protein
MRARELCAKRAPLVSQGCHSARPSRWPSRLGRRPSSRCPGGKGLLTGIWSRLALGVIFLFSVLVRRPESSGVHSTAWDRLAEAQALAALLRHRHAHAGGSLRGPVRRPISGSTTRTARAGRPSRGSRWGYQLPATSYRLPATDYPPWPSWSSCGRAAARASGSRPWPDSRPPGRSDPARPGPTRTTFHVPGPFTGPR